MAQTLSQLVSLNWDPDQIKDGLYSLERQLQLTSDRRRKKSFMTLYLRTDWSSRNS